MDKYNNYIFTFLADGIIHPFSSPAGAGFFFADKKDKTLHPCMNYQCLNDITIKNRYPLTLISSAFELLQVAKMFTKLDLRNAYHLVRIRGVNGRLLFSSFITIELRNRILKTKCCIVIIKRDIMKSHHSDSGKRFPSKGWTS